LKKTETGEMRHRLGGRKARKRGGETDYFSRLAALIEMAGCQEVEGRKKPETGEMNCKPNRKWTEGS